MKTGFPSWKVIDDLRCAWLFLRCRAKKGSIVPDEAGAGPTMSSITTSFVVFACVFGGAVLGMFLRAALPQHHLSESSKDAVKLGMGLVATMAALVLGLLVSSAKSNYDTQSTQLTEASAKIAFLDRLLAHYGPEAKESRMLLREVVIQNLERIWPQERKRNGALERPSTGAEDLLEHINQLKPKDDAQRSLQAQALNLVMSLGQTHWLMYTQGTNSASRPLVIGLIFWISMIFVSFGLFAPRNATVIAAYFVAALSVSGAILMILEMYTPYSGLIELSSAPLRAALEQLGN